MTHVFGYSCGFVDTVILQVVLLISDTKPGLHHFVEESVPVPAGRLWGPFWSAQGCGVSAFDSSRIRDAYDGL